MLIPARTLFWEALRSLPRGLPLFLIGVSMSEIPVPEIQAQARRWEHGWELWVGGECVTQVDRIEDADRQVRDWLDTVDPGADHRGWEIVITETKHCAM